MGAPDTRFKVVIPARYGSTRLPGKPLADIAGKPMVVRVAERAGQAGAEAVWIATDDARVVDAAQGHGHRALMTRSDHATGTDRICEVADQLGWRDEEIVVNVQGDEPLIDPALVRAVAVALAADPDAALSTAAHAFDDPAAFFNPNVVKVVANAAGRALYFSRAPLPWHRDGFAADRERLPAGFLPRRHIGLYAYRVSFLRRFARLSPAPIEQWEALEQLRALWHGFHIAVMESDRLPAPGVDTPEDLELMQDRFAALHSS